MSAAGQPITDVWFAEGGTVLDQNRLTVAHVVGQDEDNSDTLLIAAAPEMADLLRREPSEGHTYKWQQERRAVLKKAGL